MLPLKLPRLVHDMDQRASQNQFPCSEAVLKQPRLGVHLSNDPAFSGKNTSQTTPLGTKIMWCFFCDIEKFLTESRCVLGLFQDE